MDKKFQNNLREVKRNVRLLSRKQRKGSSPVVREMYALVNCPLFLIRVKGAARGWKYKKIQNYLHKIIIFKLSFSVSDTQQQQDQQLRCKKPRWVLVLNLFVPSKLYSQY